MAFDQTCPGCGATFELDDDFAGKSLRCTECARVFVGTKRTSKPAPAKRSSSPLIIAALGAVGLVLLLSCGVAVTLVAMSVFPRQQTQIADKDRGDDHDRKDDGIEKPADLAKDKTEQPKTVPALPVDAFGRASLRAKVADEGLVYRVFLVKDKAYNFYARSAEIEPALSIGLNHKRVAGSRSKGASFLAFTPEKSGDYTITVLARDERAGEVELQFSPAQLAPIVNIDVTRRKEGYTTNDELRVRDGVAPLQQSTLPSRSYRMLVTAGTDYQFKVQSQAFTPLLSLQKGEVAVGGWNGDVATGTIEAAYKADKSGELVVWISSDDRLGKFTFHATERTERPVPFAGRRIDFKDDVFQHVTPMEKDTPRDEKGISYIVYDLPIEAGWAYSIDHKHPAADCALKLIDPDGKLINANNRFGNARHARILHDAKNDGKYRLHVAVRDGGALSYTLEITRFKLPAPENVNTALKVERRFVSGCVVQETEVVKGSLLSSSCAWSRDGKLFVFDVDGWLHRFRMPDFFEEQRLFLGRDGNNNIQLTADGILTTRAKRREIWLIDPIDMRITRRVPLLGGTPYLSSANLRVLFAPVTATNEVGEKKSGLSGHDLTGVKPLHAYVPDRLNGLFAITPNGKYLLGRTDDNRIGRWRINDLTVDFDQAGDTYGAVLSNIPLTVSPDSQWLFRIVDAKQQALDDTKFMPPSGFGVLAYPINNLAKPAFVIDTNTKASAVASDPRSGRIYTHSESQGLMIADSTGKVLAEIPILKDSKTQNRVRRIFVHPEGGKFIAFVGLQAAGKVAYVELNNDLAPLVKAPPKPPAKGLGFLKNFEPEPFRAGDLSVQKVATFIYWNTPIWSLDGKSIYVVQSQNTIYELDAKDFSIRNRRNFFPPEMTWIRGGACWSSEGLLSLGCGERQQGADMDLILLNPGTLQTIKRVRCPNSSLVASAPNLSVAFVGGKNPFTQSPNQPELLAVDLKTGMAVKPDVAFPLSPQTFQVSPDGKYFYGTDGRSIARFRISGTKLIHEETSKPIADEEKVLPRLEMSVDGTKVWLVGQAPTTQKGGLGMHMLDALDFTKPPRVLPERAFSANIDPLTKSLVIARHDKTLDFVGANPMGGDWKCDTPRQIIMHPRGGELLLICNWNMYHVTWRSAK